MTASSSKIKSNVVAFLERYFPGNAKELLEREMRFLQVGDLETAGYFERQRLIEGLVKDVLPEKMGPGRLVMARSELFSIMKLDLQKRKAYTPRPRDREFEDEMRGEFKSLTDYILRRELDKYGLRGINQAGLDVKLLIMEAMLEKHFGSLGPIMLQEEMLKVGIKDVKSARPELRQMLMERIIKNSLEVYMSVSKARMSRSELVSTLELDLYSIQGTYTTEDGRIVVRIAHVPKGALAEKRGAEEVSLTMDASQIVGAGYSLTLKGRNSKLVTTKTVDRIRSGGSIGHSQVLDYWRGITSAVKQYFGDTVPIFIKEKKDKMKVHDMEKAHISLKAAILEELMKYYFGEMSKIFLEREVRKLGIRDVDGSPPELKIRLIDAIIGDCLSIIMTPSDIAVERAKFMRIIGISE